MSFELTAFASTIFFCPPGTYRCVFRLSLDEGRQTDVRLRYLSRVTSVSLAFVLFGPICDDLLQRRLRFGLSLAGLFSLRNEKTSLDRRLGA